MQRLQSRRGSAPLMLRLAPPLDGDRSLACCCYAAPDASFGLSHCRESLWIMRPQGLHNLTSRDFLMASSRVTRGKSWARAVATIMRSAGSPWKRAGRSLTAITVSALSGRTVSISAEVARLSHVGNGRGSSIRFLRCSICASHWQMAGNKIPLSVATRSSALRSLSGRGESGSSHHTQTWVSRMTFTAKTRSPHPPKRIRQL